MDDHHQPKIAIPFRQQVNHQLNMINSDMDITLQRKHFINQPIVTIVLTCYGVSSARDAFAKVNKRLH